MDIFVNGIKVDYDPISASTCGKVLSDIQKKFIDTGHSIVRVLLDNDDYLKKMHANPNLELPTKCKRMDLFTQDNVVITKESFIKLLNLLDSIRHGIPVIANHYRQGRRKQGASLIKNVMSTIKPMVDFTNLIALQYVLDLDKIKTSTNQSVAEQMRAFLKSFSSLVQIQQTQSNLEISRYLEGQFLEGILGWKNIVKLLLRESSYTK